MNKQIQTNEISDSQISTTLYDTKTLLDKTNGVTQGLEQFIVFDFMEFLKPGFYEISHLPSGKRYIGETQNLLERLGKHVAALQKGVHDSSPLQADWNKEKNENNLKNNFSLRVINLVASDDPKARKKQEREYLLAQDPVYLYNVVYDPSVPKAKRENYRKIIHIKGVDYESIGQAASSLHLGDTTIRRWLNNPNLPDCYVKQTIKHGYCKCVVDDAEYPSITSLVETGLAPSTLFARRRLKSPNFPNWYYLQDDKRHNLRPMQKKSFPKPCVVDGISYPSLRALIVAGVATNRSFAERRLKSQSFPNWNYV